MTIDANYRISLAIVIVLTMSVTVYHRLRAASTGEKISHREEGYALATILRLSGLILWIATFGWLFFPRAFRWASMPLPDWLRWVGVAIGLAGAGLMYWTLSNLGKNLTDTVVTRKNATLVTTGPYHWVRHPFYVTAAVLMTSVTLIAASWFVALGGIMVLTLLAIRTRKEEAMLTARFGDDYRTYMARTGRFFPRL